MLALVMKRKRKLILKKVIKKTKLQKNKALLIKRRLEYFWSQSFHNKLISPKLAMLLIMRPTKLLNLRTLYRLKTLQKKIQILMKKQFQKIRMFYKVQHCHYQINLVRQTSLSLERDLKISTKAETEYINI